MTGDEQLLVVVSPGEDDDEGVLVDLTAMLRQELLTLDVDDVRPPDAGSAPEGAKGLGDVIGVLAVQLGSLEGLRVLVDLVRGWAGRSRREVEVTIGGDSLKLSGASSEQQERIIDAWLERHAAGS
jgi:Effector Associated Constant Component 1